MKDETQDLAAIRVRINEIEAELFAESNYTNSSILSADAARLERERNERFAALGSERVQLLGKLPPTGMAGGHRLVFAQILGGLIPSDWPDVEPETVAGPIDEWDWSE
jgi:hypothetical protein